MKTNFKKLTTTAAVGAALAAGSMSVNAYILGVPGEAYLVPFVLANTANTMQPTYGRLDTVVRIVVPASVGIDDVINGFTAPHTTPTNPVATGGASDLPDAAALDPKKAPNIHWFFLNQKSEHVLDGSFPVTPDDVILFDWESVVNGNPVLANQLGYLVFTTDQGAIGKDANFSFTADAYFVTNADQTIGGVVRPGGAFSSVNIPALPLADGADANVAGEKPTLRNNVVEPFSMQVVASPLVSGIRTSISDGKPQFSLVDLELASGVSTPWGIDIQDMSSMLVVWNDQNAANWGRVSIEVFDAHENACSWSVSLPYQLNVTWVPWDGPQGSGAGGGAAVDPYTVPGFITAPGVDGKPQGIINNLCDPNASTLPNSFVGNRLDGGFVKLRLPEPTGADTGLGGAGSAGAAFTINFGGLWTNGTFIQGYATETVLGHDRGKFNAR